MMSKFIFILFVINYIYCYDSFVYDKAPKDMIKAAKQIGENERLNYLQSLQYKKYNEEEKISLYSEHLSMCSTVANDISKKLSMTLGDNPNEINASKLKSKNILESIGIDTVSTSLMLMPIYEMESTIHLACLKNELQFQCAYGFIQNMDKINEHIVTMMENDGNIKMMFQSECKRPDITPITYACIGDNTDTWINECGVSINAYNNTRNAVNRKMGVAYANAITVIQEATNKATTEEELSQIINEANDLIITTLNGISRLESFKCRSYYQMERCLFKTVEKKCDKNTVDALKTILRVGYLRRERGDSLHMQFLESGIPPSKACLKTFNS